jgi:hypothetical protein
MKFLEQLKIFIFLVFGAVVAFVSWYIAIIFFTLFIIYFISKFAVDIKSAMREVDYEKSA